MTKKTQFFVGLTIAAGAGLLAACLDSGAISHSSTYLLYSLLAWLSSTLKVRLPGVTGTISLNFVFILISVALFTFSETVLLACGACAVQCLWQSRSKARLVQVSFNVSALAISSGAAHRLSHLLFGSRETPLALLLAVAASFYFTADTLLVSGVLSLVGHKSLFKVWQQCYLWSFPYYLVGAAIAGLAVETSRSTGSVMSLLVLLPMCLVYVFYRIFIERMGTRSLSAV